MKKLSKIAWGLVLIAVGVVIALNAFGITDINLFFDGWWTLFIIIPCTVGLFNEYDKMGNLIGLGIGVFLLLCCQDVLNFDMLWKLLLPAIIILIGAKMIFGGVFGGKSGEVQRKLLESGGKLKNGTAIFSGQELDFAGEVFEGAQLDAVFGGVECNLSHAILEKDCVINASAVFGGIDIWVPDSVNIKVNSNSLFGGVSNKAHHNRPENTVTLYINATCMFGGVDIK